jgi:hypothetical protein
MPGQKKINKKTKLDDIQNKWDKFKFVSTVAIPDCFKCPLCYQVYDTPTALICG